MGNTAHLFDGVLFVAASCYCGNLTRNPKYYIHQNDVHLTNFIQYSNGIKIALHDYRWYIICHYICIIDIFTDNKCQSGCAHSHTRNPLAHLNSLKLNFYIKIQRNLFISSIRLVYSNFLNKQRIVTRALIVIAQSILVDFFERHVDTSRSVLTFCNNRFNRFTSMCGIVKWAIEAWTGLNCLGTVHVNYMHKEKWRKKMLIIMNYTSRIGKLFRRASIWCCSNKLKFSIAPAIFAIIFLCAVVFSHWHAKDSSIENSMETKTTTKTKTNQHPLILKRCER